MDSRDRFSDAGSIPAASTICAPSPRAAGRDVIIPGAPRGRSPPATLCTGSPRRSPLDSVGLNADNDAHVYLNRLLTEHEVVSKKARGAVDLIMGGIPVGTLKKTVSDGVLIVGDAAGQVKPISYGGIYMAESKDHVYSARRNRV